MATLPKVISNHWSRVGELPLDRAWILQAAICPEGLDIARFRALETCTYAFESAVAHVVSVVRGRARLILSEETLQLESGVHVYLPPGLDARFELDAKTELVSASAPSKEQSRGEKLLVRDETFLAACASETQSLRWILTPQYLSRRVFLHHDQLLLSKAKNPVSWFHTTMFDVRGLPLSEDGEPVFKMSYNSRTELNVCYDVAGVARFRAALHPYVSQGQKWEPWLTLDSESTYHVNEPAPDRDGRRNKHEIYISGGHVTLLCMFDPAPSGIERHRPGEYSDYEPLADVMARSEYASYRSEMSALDAMVDRLSMAKARGQLASEHNSAEWALYQQGSIAQQKLERALYERVEAEKQGRHQTLERWLYDPRPTT